MVAPCSKFSKTVEMGNLVPRKTHAPLIFSGSLSTPGHCDQSRAMLTSLILILTRVPSRPCSGLLNGPITKLPDLRVEFAQLSGSHFLRCRFRRQAMSKHDPHDEQQ